MISINKACSKRILVAVLVAVLVPTTVALAALGTTEIVSVDSSGTQGNNHSQQANLSSDGRYVAFESYATNLVAGDSNGFYDIFVRDRTTGTTERVSVDSSGTQGNGNSYQASISADGLYVAFRSGSTNLVAGDSNIAHDIFVHDGPPGPPSVSP